MAQSLSKWLKPALSYLPGALRPVVRNELAATFKEFYQRSSSLREVATASVVSGTSAYIATATDPATIVIKPLQVAYNGRPPLRILTRKPDRVDYPLGSPTHWYLTGIDVVNLWPQPQENITNGLSIYQLLRPNTDADAVPDISLEEHFDTIMDGLLGRMMQQPAKPYSNLPLAQYHLKRFRSQIALYKGLANKGGVPGGAGWSFNSFGK